MINLDVLVKDGVYATILKCPETLPSKQAQYAASVLGLGYVTVTYQLSLSVGFLIGPCRNGVTWRATRGTYAAHATDPYGKRHVFYMRPSMA